MLADVTHHKKKKNVRGARIPRRLAMFASSFELFLRRRPWRDCNRPQKGCPRSPQGDGAQGIRGAQERRAGGP